MTNSVLMDIGSAYNLKVKIAGNTIEFKRYRFMQKRQKRGEGEQTFVPFVLSDEDLQEYEVGEKIIDEQAHEEKYYKNLRAVRVKVFDIINANVRNNVDYVGNHQRIKFMTLTFGDEYMIDKIKEAYEELTKFMQRLSYHFFQTKSNVIRYLSTFELQPCGKIHFHIVCFNMPYISNLAKDGYPLQKIWGNGYVGINALKRKNGKNIDLDKIAGYIIKYMTKGTKIENGKVKIDEDFANKDIYRYENYKAFGLEGVKKYSTSKGLKKPIEYTAFLDAEQFKKMIAEMKDKKQFKKVYDKKDKNKYEYIKARTYSVVVNGIHINDIWAGNGQLKYEAIEHVHEYLKSVQNANMKRLNGSFKILKQKDYDEHKWVEREYMKSNGIFDKSNYDYRELLFN